jgi:hypothetical protein
VYLGQWFNTVLEESDTPAAGDYPQGACMRAESAAEHMINLPTHSRVSLQDIEEIVRLLKVIAEREKQAEDLPAAEGLPAAVGTVRVEAAEAEEVG